MPLLSGGERKPAQGSKGQGKLEGKGAQRLEEEDKCGKATAECGTPRYKAWLNWCAPEPSPKLKRRPRLELTAQFMTWGPRPTWRGERVTNKGAKRRDLNRRPHARGARRKLS